MIIYAQNRAFPHKTFVTCGTPGDKIARIRAQLLHILYELGKDDHLFRLRYKGQILRDAFCLEDYAIPDNAVLTMVPTGKSQETLMEIRSVTSAELAEGLHGQPVEVKRALEAEVKTFNTREAMVKNFKTLLHVHFVFVFLSVLTIHWYSIFWLGVFWLLAMYFVPTYSRIGGFVGNTSHLKTYFCMAVIGVSVIFFAVSLYFCIDGWIFVAGDRCSKWTADGTCSHVKVYSATFFTVHALVLLMTTLFGLLMMRNFNVEVGDFIEKFLVQERDVDQVMEMARNGRLKDKRTAAYDLAAMAASSDDNKFRIVAEGGLDVLRGLALSRDEVTREHAVEALAEILTIPSIQDTFVEMGGVHDLTAVLRSPSPRAMQEAAVALYTIVSDSEENKMAVIEDQGLDDLCHAAREGTIYCQRTVASIFLELVFNSEIRAQIATRDIAAQALVHLCQSNDPDTQRFALQSLEVLAIESSDLICAQEDLIGHLLDFPYRTMDDKLYLLAGKILLYFAENRETCEQLINYPRARESLLRFAQSYDPILQKVTIKILFCALEYPELRARARYLTMASILEQVMDHPADTESFEMADQSLKLLNSDDGLTGLPTLSTLEKLNKLGPKNDGAYGSQSSLSTDKKYGSDRSSGSSSEVKKKAGR